MTLLDDARQLDCVCDASEDRHSDSCVLILKPRIVAALESLEAIVREVAKDPFLDGTASYDSVCQTCDFNSDDGQDNDDPANHEPSCLWRRALALYPDSRT